MDDKLQAYRYADTMGKTPLDLILVVYDGAIKALKTALENYSRNNPGSGYDELQKARRMVVHLYTTLDNQKGGEVARHLGKMYTWVINQITVLEATKDVNELESVISMLTNLRSGWAALKTEPSSAATAKAKQPAAGESETRLHVMTTA